MGVRAGQTIGGKYELEKLLGKGSMGEVWRARHTTLEGTYAVKLVEVTEFPDVAGRFQLEAHIAAKLSKKTRHIVSVTDHGEQGALAYLVMQLLEGESLDHRIGEAAPLALAEVAVIVKQVARALKHAHADGFLHRDLKPANIFLTKDEDGRIVVKLLDFGIARSMTPIRTRSPYATAKDTLVGTPTYMSPEQTMGLATIDHRCDLWSLAVVAYEALTREVPFEGESIQDVLIAIGIGRQVPIRTRRADLPDAVVAFFDRAFADEIGDRFGSASELASAFARAAEGAADVPLRLAPSLAPPASPLPASPLPASESRDDIVLPMQRGPRRAVWLALGALLLLGAGAFARRLLRAPAPSEEVPTATASSANAPPSASSAPLASVVIAPSIVASASTSPSLSLRPGPAAPRPSSVEPAPPSPSASASTTPSASSASSASSALPVEEPPPPIVVAPPAASSAPPPPDRTIDRGEVF